MLSRNAWTQAHSSARSATEFLPPYSPDSLGHPQHMPQDCLSLPVRLLVRVNASCLGFCAEATTLPFGIEDTKL